MTFAQAIRELDLRHPITEKPVTPKELIQILKDDVVLVLTRPGSWEAGNMQTVLMCHGFLRLYGD